MKPHSTPTSNSINFNNTRLLSNTPNAQSPTLSLGLPGNEHMNVVLVYMTDVIGVAKGPMRQYI